jgi:hypothetical protein
MERIKIKNFKSPFRSKLKTQIVLIHTSRSVENYISSIKNRYLKNKKVPNYLITRKGELYHFLEDDESSNFLNKPIDKETIFICLENLGWLEKVPLESYHINWCGDIYIGEVFNRKWRDYFLWQPYTEIQLDKCSELCNGLLEKFSIDKKSIGTNTQVDFIENFEGISSRSNFDKKYTDLSPAFDFELFEKKLKNE